MNKLCIDNRILLGEVSRLISEGHEVTILCKGNSMDPFIRGDMDSVRLGSPVDIEVGDIVLAYLEGERYVLHRVFGLEDETVTLMGDGNLYGKEHCKLSDVVAKALAIVTPSGAEKKITSGRIWRKLVPVRRIILGIYHRIYRRKYYKSFNRNED